MIAEFLSYLFHALCCPKYLREMGILQELIGVEARSGRLKHAWQEHLDFTKSVILDQASNSPRNKVMIIGAGLINDIPLKELSERFKQVVLVDLIFMQSTINQIKYFDNVSFLEIDISGNLKALYQTIQEYKISGSLQELNARINSLINFVPDFFMTDNELDLVISLNLLSQLPLCAEQWLIKQKIDFDFSCFYKSLIKNHLEYLKRLEANNKKIILISDTQKQILNSDNQFLAVESSIKDLNIPDYLSNAKSVKSWNWLLAPLGELDPKYQMQLNVEAFAI